MIVRIYKNIDGTVSVLTPTEEKFLQNMPEGEFDVEYLKLPPATINEKCIRCAWRIKGKTLIIDETVFCIHNRINELKKIILNGDNTDKLNAIVELETIKLKKDE